MRLKVLVELPGRRLDDVEVFPNETLGELFDRYGLGSTARSYPKGAKVTIYGAEGPGKPTIFIGKFDDVVVPEHADTVLVTPVPFGD